MAGLDLSWLELTIAVLLYGQSARAGTRQGLSALAERCLDQREESMQEASGQFLTLMEILLPVSASAPLRGCIGIKATRLYRSWMFQS